jgi:hypothetical protein
MNSLLSRKVGLLMLLPTVALFAGIGIGKEVWQTDPVETQVIPAPTLRGYSGDALRQLCVHTAAFTEFANADSTTDGVREERRLSALQIAATPLSDRGLVCTASASVLSRTSMPGGTALHNTKDARITFLVAINGDSELISDDFAKALLASKTVGVMASNWGNDGSVVPVPKLNFGKY